MNLVFFFVTLIAMLVPIVLMVVIIYKKIAAFYRKLNLSKHLHSINKDMARRFKSLCRGKIELRKAFYKALVKATVIVLNFFKKLVEVIVGYFKSFWSKEFKYVMKGLFKALLYLVLLFSIAANSNKELSHSIFKFLENSIPTMYSIVKFISNVYFILVVMGFIQTIIGIINSAISEKNILAKIWFSCGSTVLLGILLFSGYDVLKKDILRGHFSFVTVLTSLVCVLPLTYYGIKKFFDSSQNSMIKIIGAVSTILVLNIYILFMFGSYNAAIVKENININNSFIHSFLRVVHYGAKYTFNCPDPKDTKSIVPITQYIIWNLYNLVVVGFFIAYFYDLIKSRRESKEVTAST
ncbi:MAG: hypothetical protein N3B21_05455 [Clostridia bacterium]|nr:hypothetical protein [Clostridia bacterium]